MREEEERKKLEKQKEEEAFAQAAEKEKELYGDDEEDLSKLSPLQRSIREQERRMRMEEKMAAAAYEQQQQQQQGGLAPVPRTAGSAPVAQNVRPVVPPAQAGSRPVVGGSVPAGRSQPVIRPQAPNAPQRQPVVRTQPTMRQPVVRTSPTIRQAPSASAPAPQQPQKKSGGFNPFKKKVVYKQEREAGANEWKCETCGLVNANYVTTCACGYRRSAKRPRKSNSVIDIQQPAVVPQSTLPEPRSQAPTRQVDRPPVRPQATSVPIQQPRPQTAVPQNRVQPVVPPVQRNVPAAPPVQPPVYQQRTAPQAAVVPPVQRPAAPVTPPTPVTPLAPVQAQRSTPAAPVAPNRITPSFEQDLPPKPVTEEYPDAVVLEPSEIVGTGRKMDMTVDWTCFRCGRSNASYVTTCACGVTKKRAAFVYEKGVDPYAAREEEEKKKQAERDKAMEAILEQKSAFGPKMFDSNVIVEVETISRQSPLERKMTNALYSLVDKASQGKSAAPEKEDRLSRYAEEQNVPKAETPAPANPVEPAKPSNDREPYFDEWKCPDCGTINNDYVSMCSCGCTKRKAQRLANGAPERPARAQAQGNATSVSPAVSAPPIRSTQAASPVTPPPVPGKQAGIPQRDIPPSPVRMQFNQNIPSSVAAAVKDPTAEAKPAQSAPPVPKKTVSFRGSPNVQPAPTPAPKPNNDREPYFDEWKCPDCGTINNDYVTMCSCGCSQRRAKRLQAQKKK